MFHCQKKTWWKWNTVVTSYFWAFAEYSISGVRSKHDSKTQSVFQSANSTKLLTYKNLTYTTLSIYILCYAGGFFITYYDYYRRRRIIFWVGDPILKKHDEILQILRFLILKISESRDARPLQFWCPWLLLYFDDRHSHSWNSVIWYDKEKKSSIGRCNLPVKLRDVRLTL